MSDIRSEFTGKTKNGEIAYRSQIQHSLIYSMNTDILADPDKRNIRTHSNIVTVDRPDSSQVCITSSSNHYHHHHHHTL